MHSPHLFLLGGRGSRQAGSVIEELQQSNSDMVLCWVAASGTTIV